MSEHTFEALRRLFAPTLASRLAAVVSAWSPETSSNPKGWSESNRALGQADVTALVVQELAGGDIISGKAVLPDGRRVDHCWNRLGFMEFDLTITQYPEGTDAEPETAVLPREGLLALPGVRARYELLSSCYWIALVCADVSEGRY